MCPQTATPHFESLGETTKLGRDRLHWMAKKATGRGVLETHHDAICNVLSVSKTTLISLTGKLFSKHIIDRRTKTSVVSKGGYKGADILLDHVEMKVESKPHILQIVLKAMKEHESLVDIVEQMENWEGEDTQISGKL